MNGLAERLLDLVFPRRCTGCGRVGSLLCQGCLAGLAPLRPPWCRGCGLPLRRGSRCDGCREAAHVPVTVRSAYPYEGPLREAIIEFKYRGLRSLGPELAVLLAGHLRDHPTGFDVIVPVPLTRERQRERGYNQAEVLARALGRMIDAPVAPDALRRVRSATPQARINARSSRFENVAGAFGAGATPVAGRRVLLIDDVCTTGATLQACGEALHAAGAAGARALTLAREL